MLQVRGTAGNGNHFVGACAVGTVVDGDLKVFGFENLRVVDASAIPDIPLNSGPAASVYMLAEHIAERIIADGPPATEPVSTPVDTPAPSPATTPPPNNGSSPSACGGNGEPVCTGDALAGDLMHGRTVATPV